MARRLSADYGRGYQSRRTRALAYTNSLNDDSEELRNIKKRMDEQQSDESIESEREARRWHDVTTNKQHSNKTRRGRRRRQYDDADVDAEASEQDDFISAHGKRQAHRANEVRKKQCSWAGTRKSRYDNNSDSASETEMEIEAGSSDTSCGSKSNQRWRRSCDSMVYNSDCLGYTKYKRGVAGEQHYGAASEECIPLIFDEDRRKHRRRRADRSGLCDETDEADFQLTNIKSATDESNAKPARNSDAASSAKEVMKLMGNLFRTFGNRNSAMKLGKANRVRDVTAEKIAQIMHDSIIESKTPPKVSAYVEKSLPRQFEYETHVTTIPRLRVQYPTANQSLKKAEVTQHITAAAQPREYTESCYAEQSKSIAACQETGAQLQSQSYIQGRVPKVPLATLVPPQTARTEIAQTYGGRTQPMQYVFPPYLPPLIPPESPAHLAAPQQLVAQAATQENTAPYTAHSVMQSAPYATLTPPTPQSTLQAFPTALNKPLNGSIPFSHQHVLRSMDLSNQNGVQEFALSRSAAVAQNSSLTDENLLQVSYITPQGPVENQESGEFNWRGKSDTRPSYAISINTMVGSSTPHTSVVSENLKSPRQSMERTQLAATGSQLEEIIDGQENIQNSNYTNNGEKTDAKSNESEATNEKIKGNENPIRAEHANVLPQSRKVEVNEANKLRSEKRSSLTKAHGGVEETYANENINGTKELHRQSMGNRSKLSPKMDDSQQDGYYERKSRRETSSSSCSSDYVRERLRRKRQKKMDKYAEKESSHNKKRKHYRKESYSDSESEKYSNGYQQRGRYNKRGKRRRHCEPYTPTDSESGDEMNYSLSRTSCKAIKKCCSRIVAICRMAKDTAATQTDECCCGCDGRIQQAPDAETSKLDDDIQRKIIDCLTNTNRNELRQIMQLNEDKKKCKVCSCGIADEENVVPVMKNDMIILKIEGEDAAERRHAEQVKQYSHKLSSRSSNCRCNSNCKASDTESGIIRAMITKKRVHEKTQRSMAKSCSSLCVGCACTNEAEAEKEFVEDLLRKQRSEKKLQNHSQDCVCDCAAKAKELAAEIMMEMINSHIRTMCRGRLTSTNNLADTGPMTSESEIVSMDSAKTLTKTSVTEQRGPTSTERQPLSEIIKERCANRCTCDPKDEMEVQNNSPADGKRVVDQETGTSSVTTWASKSKTKEVESQRADAAKSGRSKARETTASSESLISNVRADKIHDCAGNCTCKPSKFELEAQRSKSERLKARETRDNSKQAAISRGQNIKSAAREKHRNEIELVEQRSKSEKSKKRTARETKASSEESIISRARDNKTIARRIKLSKNESEAQIKRVLGRETKTSSEDIIIRNAREDQTDALARVPKIKPAKGKRESGVHSKDVVARKTREQIADSQSGIVIKSNVSDSQSHFTDRRPKACRPDCACKKPRVYTSEPSQEDIAERRSDFRTKNETKTKIIPERAELHSAQDELDTDDTEENVLKNGDSIVARTSNSDIDTSEADDSIREEGERKSVQKFIIDIKASKKARASCTLITYPKSNKNSERKMPKHTPIADVNSNSSFEQNEQRAALCAELAMNELLPNHSLRTLLTKLSSPNGKLFYADDLHTPATENTRIFTLDQKKLLDMKRANNGKLNPTTVMSQSMRMAEKNVTFQPLLVNKKRELQISNSAPSLNTSQMLTARKNFQHVDKADSVLKRNIPLGASQYSLGRSDQSRPIPKSESAEMRANTRPVIKQTSDSNYNIMRLWPDQKKTKIPNQQRELMEIKPTTHADSSRQAQKTQYAREQSPVNENAKSQFNLELPKRRYSQRTVRPRLESGTSIEFQSNTSINEYRKMPRNGVEVKKQRNHSPTGNAPLKMVNILAAANRRRPSSKKSSDSNESNNSRQQIALRKTNTEERWRTSVADSAHSMRYTDRLHSPTMIPTGVINKCRTRITRFNISDDEQTASDAEYISLQYESSDSDRQYQFDLERKKKLWRKGTVREALEVEEESERAKNLQRTTLTGECLERAIHYPTRVWNEERRQLNLKRNGAGIFTPF